MITLAGLPKIDKGYMGIDPGTACLGIAFLLPNEQAVLYEFVIDRVLNPVSRMITAQEICQWVDWSHFYTPDAIVIEGASFGDTHRQVELAEQRAAMALYWSKNKQVEIVPPMSIRKQAFGSAKTKAVDVWPDFPKDAAVALSCAMCAYAMFDK